MAQSLIRKASGETEPFRADKLAKSLQRVDADPKTIERVLRRARKDVDRGLSTKQLERMARDALKRERGVAAARYRLRGALSQMGPTGYPFERFVAELLKEDGFHTATGRMLIGKSGVRHEVDVVAERDGEKKLVECKFRRDSRQKCDVKVSMYVSARGRDLLGELIDRDDASFWVITNAKFTTDAVRFADSVGLRLLGWDHPAPRTLARLVEQAGLHPLTCLTSLKRRSKTALLNEGLVLCRDLLRPEPFERAGISPGEQRAATSEVRRLLQETVRVVA